VSRDDSGFTVEGIGKFAGHLDRLILLAESRGLRTLLVEVLRQMSENLKHHPREWGDPYRNYRGLDAVAYEKTILPARIRVKYAVHNSKPLVWVSALVPLAGSPFEAG
jgi:hypothetical protein